MGRGGEGVECWEIAGGQSDHAEVIGLHGLTSSHYGLF